MSKYLHKYTLYDGVENIRFYFWNKELGMKIRQMLARDYLSIEFNGKILVKEET